MIYLGADHNGYWLKEEIKQYLRRKKVLFRDLGAARYQKGDDYPDFAKKVAEHISGSHVGILICGSGHGMAIAANKFKGVRAILAESVFSAKKSREDDHANVLALSAWETPVEKAKRIVAAWLVTKPSLARRHLRRVKKIGRFER